MSDLPELIIDREFHAPRELVWHHYAAVDSQGNDIENPMMKDWPKVLLTTVTFKDKGESTDVRLSQIPVDATDDEIAGFAKMKDGMSGGWGKGYAIIDEILTELQAR